VIRASAENELDPVRTYAVQAAIPLFSVPHLNGLLQIIAQLRPRAVVISSFNRILSSEILSLSYFINVHYSPLPRYRGRANVNWALINGEPTAAISIHIVSSSLDSGDVLFQEEVPIQPGDTAASLYCRLNAIQERELGRVVVRAVAGAVGISQDHQNATYGCARIPDDGEINWSQSTIEIDRLIRALSPPFPGAFTHLNGKRLVIVRAGPVCNPPNYVGRVPGRIVHRSNAAGWVDVLTGDGILRVFEVIPESGCVSLAAALIKSTRSTLGLSRLDLLRRINALESRLATLQAAHHS
jgi:methionyl-tRNA formyltransferase